MSKARTLLRLARLQQVLAGLLIVRIGLLIAALYGLAGFRFSLGTFGCLLVADLVAAAGCMLVSAYMSVWQARLEGDRSLGLLQWLFSAFLLALPIEGLIASVSLYRRCAETLEHNGVKVTWLLAAKAGELDRLREAAARSREH